MRKGIKVIGGLMSVGIPVYLAGRWQQKCIDRWKEEASKQRAMFLVMNQWTNVKQANRILEEYFLKNELRKIAIYGMGLMGQQLIKELKDSSIETAYGIDRNSDGIVSGIKVVTMDEELADVDAVVVTVLKEFDEIRDALTKKLNCSVVAIEDILNEF